MYMLFSKIDSLMKRFHNLKQKSVQIFVCNLARFARQIRGGGNALEATLFVPSRARLAFRKYAKRMLKIRKIQKIFSKIVIKLTKIGL